MSETQIEELQRRAAMLIDANHSCVEISPMDDEAVYIDLGPMTGIQVNPAAARLRVLHHGDAYYRASEIITVYDEARVEEVLKILRLRTVLDELSDV